MHGNDQGIRKATLEPQDQTVRHESQLLVDGTCPDTALQIVDALPQEWASSSFFSKNCDRARIRRSAYIGSHSCGPRRRTADQTIAARLLASALPGRGAAPDVGPQPTGGLVARNRTM